MVKDHRPEHYRAIWNGKPVLQEIYRDYYRRIAARCVPGRTLEVGGGAGNLKAALDQVTCTDILPASWLDVVADAQSLPFADGSFNNIVLVDVLHHLVNPRAFLCEAQRLLKPGGRIVMLEPAITPMSWLCYRYGHQEGVDFRQDPLGLQHRGSRHDPFDANQAIPTLLFGRFRGRFEREFPRLHLKELEKLSFFAYPLSGGFRPWTFLTVSLARVFLRLENFVQPLLGPVMAFRLLVVLEQTARSAP